MLHAAVFVLQDFSSNPSWADRDSNEMLVTWTSGFGNGPGSMWGQFDSRDAPFAETDAMRINSGSAPGFIGNYNSMYGGSGFDLDAAYFQFQFYSDDVLPSDLRIRINGGGSTFSRSVYSQVIGGLDNWYTVNVDLSYSGWLGGTSAQYSNVFNSVSWIDIQLTRSGTGVQNYYVDNFGLYSVGEIVDPSGDAVPEVATTQFLLVGVILLAGGVRRKLRKTLSIEAEYDFYG